MEERKTVLINMAENIAAGLYRQDKESGLGQMNALFAGLLELAKEAEKESDTSLDIQQMNQVLVEAMNALEARDYVLLADILSYDLKELLTAG